MMTKKQFFALYDAEKQLAAPPRWEEAADFPREGMVRPLFYDGPCWKGKPTRVFAWMGMPDGATAKRKVPAVVLVHGGGATALANWVKLWNERGYAAISMDVCGGMPCWSENACYRRGGWPRHPWSGPAGWGCWRDANLPPREQWIYHAVSAVLRGTALLRSMPEVDASRVGITGISWGGYLTLLAAALDSRFAFAAPVYGCGFLDFRHFSEIADGAYRVTQAKLDAWSQLWDPAAGLAYIHMPVLMLSDAEDGAFELPSWEKTAQAIPGPVYRSLRTDYVHDHTISWQSRTMPDFFSAVLEKRPVPQLGGIQRRGGRLRCAVQMAGRSIASASLFVTRAAGIWADCRWTAWGSVKCQDGVLEASERPFATAAFFQVTDDRGCRWSSPVYFAR